jgi:hypothetical protein
LRRPPEGNLFIGANAALADMFSVIFPGTLALATFLIKSACALVEDAMLLPPFREFAPRTPRGSIRPNQGGAALEHFSNRASRFLTVYLSKKLCSSSAKPPSGSLNVRAKSNRSRRRLPVGQSERDLVVLEGPCGKYIESQVYEQRGVRAFQGLCLCP